MKLRMFPVAATAVCVLSLGLLAAPRAHAQVANPWPPQPGYIQVGFRSERVQNIQVYSGNQAEAVRVANQFSGTLWAYMFSGELLIVPANGTFTMADFPPSNQLPYEGTMGPNSPFPGAAISMQLTGEGYLWDAVQVEIQGGGIDVVFDQLLDVIYSYSPDTPPNYYTPPS